MTERTSSLAKESGKYDSVIVSRVYDKGVGDTEGKTSTTYIAFDPTQIKSVFNRGTFDGNDPRILNQHSADVAGADLNDPATVADAQKQWAEKGTESPYFKGGYRDW